MNILTFDTATENEIVVLQSGQKYANESKTVKSSHSVSIFDSIDNGLNKLNISLHDVSLIGVGIGPGSFTGIRIAVTTARMLAQVLDIPLIGISSHLLYATSCIVKKESNILIAFDAKKNRVFGAIYKTGTGTIPETIIAPGDYTIEYLLKNIRLPNRTYTIGSGIEKYNNTVSRLLPDYKHIDNFVPDAVTISKLVYNTYANSDSATGINTVLPDYARKSDAEIAKNQHHQS